MKHILDLTKDWDEPQIAELLKLINLRRDKVTRVWDYVFGKQPTLFERDETTKMIETHGYDKVKQAFAEAGKQAEKGKHSLSYVQAVLKNMKQQEAIDKVKTEAKQIREFIPEKRTEKETSGKDWEGMFKDILGAKEI